MSRMCGSGPYILMFVRALFSVASPLPPTPGGGPLLGVGSWAAGTLLCTKYPPKQLANAALYEAGHFGYEPTAQIAPPPTTEIDPTVLKRAVDQFVGIGEAALIDAASTHAPVVKEKRFRQPYTSEATRQMSILKGVVLHTRQRIRILGHNTLLRAAFETLRSWRLLQLTLRGARKGKRGTRRRLLRNAMGSETPWPIHNVHFRQLYLRIYFVLETLFTLLGKKTKRLAAIDRNTFWERETDQVEQMWNAGKIRDLYQQTRLYAGKRRPAGILYLTDAQGNALASPEARMDEWTREFKQRFNPQVAVQYDCTSEASGGEWQDPSRDDNALTTDEGDRQRQKELARSQLLPGHTSLLQTPSRDEVQKGLLSAKLHRSAGEDGITAELIRAALPWITTWMIILWKWMAACAHVVQSWKGGVITTLFKKLDPAKASNYRGITLLAVSGKCILHILVSRLVWIIDSTLLENQYGFRPYRGRLQSISILQRLIESGGTLPNGIFALYIDLEQCFDRIPRRKLWRVLRKRGIPKHFVKLLRDLYSNTRCKVRSENLYGK